MLDNRQIAAQFSVGESAFSLLRTGPGPAPWPTQPLIQWVPTGP